jgi:hypothetical protein
MRNRRLRQPPAHRPELTQSSRHRAEDGASRTRTGGLLGAIRANQSHEQSQFAGVLVTRRQACWDSKCTQFAGDSRELRPQDRACGLNVGVRPCGLQGTGRGTLPLSSVAVGKTPGEPAGSLVRVGSENRHLVRRTQPARRERTVHGGSEVHLRKRAALFLRRLFPTASSTSSTPDLRSCSSSRVSHKAPASPLDPFARVGSEYGPLIRRARAVRREIGRTLALACTSANAQRRFRRGFTRQSPVITTARAVYARCSLSRRKGES